MGRYSGRSFRLILMCIVSILLFVMELVIANIGNSLSLASDAFAVLSHFLSMIIALFGVRVSSIKQHRKSTFGFLRADVVGAFGNSIFAVALMFSILVEAVKRYINPQKTEEPLLILSAGIIGLLFNILNYVILDCCYCTAHMPQGDTETGDSLNTQNEPEETMKKEKKSEALNIRVSKLSAVPGISSVHEVHIWELISGKIIATLHIKYQKDRDYQDASRKIREIFHSVGIHNVTIQFEQVDLKDPVEQKDLLLLCSSPCISKGCEKQLCCPPGALPLAHVNGCAEHNGCPPLDTYPSDGLRRRETTEVAIEVSLDSCLSEHGQAPSKSQEDPHYVNSTHF
uniref:Solute carrier family 30 member 10 n=1 Tax=Canis lupus familiaris TaxID=9615 RepID=A0A8P0NW63_CANLF